MNKPRPTRKLAELTAEFMADAFKKQGFASTELVTRWKEIAGPEIAACSEPVKLQWQRTPEGEQPEPATLVLRAEGPAALEIQHQVHVILERVNRFFGWSAVGKLAFRQAPLSRARRPARTVSATSVPGSRDGSAAPPAIAGGVMATTGAVSVDVSRHP